MSPEPFQIEPCTVQCGHQTKTENGWIKCEEWVEIKGPQSEWPLCAKGHKIRTPDPYFCWQPKKCLTSGRCMGTRACND